MVAALALQTQTAPARAAEEPGMKAGFAERDITPDLGMEQPGGYGKSFHRTFHDPCKVRAVVFDDGRSRVALVGIDALIIRRETVAPVRQEIQQKCGIPGDAILIGASHSHSSGPTGMILPGRGQRRPGGVQPPLPHEKRHVLYPSRQGESRHHRAGRPRRSAGGRDRLV